MGFPNRVTWFNFNPDSFYISVNRASDDDLLSDIILNILNPQEGPPGGLPLNPRVEPMEIDPPAQPNPQPKEIDLVADEEMPLGTECCMMRDTIPEGCGVKIAGEWFDLRGILKYMLTQKEPLTPQKQKLSSKDLEIICKKLGITTDQFKNLFLGEDGNRRSQDRVIGLLAQITILAFQSILGGGGNLDRIRAIEQQIEDLNRPNQTEAFMRLLDGAVNEKKITRELADKFAAVLN